MTSRKVPTYLHLDMSAGKWGVACGVVRGRRSGTGQIGEVTHCLAGFLDADLLAINEPALADLTAGFASGPTPAPIRHKSRCKGLSLVELCRPETQVRPDLARRG